MTEPPTASLPKYQSIRIELERQIQSGEWTPGSRIPSLDELTARFGASKHVVRQAIGLLEADGFLFRRQGSGTYVCRPDESPPVQERRQSLRFVEWMSSEPGGQEMVSRIKASFQARFAPAMLYNWRNDFFHQEEALIHSIARGKGPDVAQIVSKWTAGLARLDSLMPLDELLPPELLAGHFQASGIETGVFGGRLYALDWLPGALILYGNRNLMERAGLDPDTPPSSMDQLDFMIRKVSRLERTPRGDRIYGFGVTTVDDELEVDYLLPIFWAFGGKLLQKIGEGPGLVNDGDRQAIGWLGELAREGCIPHNVSLHLLRRLFAQDRIGFLIDGPWLRGILRGLSPLGTAIDRNYTVTTIPAGNRGESISTVFNISLCCFHQSKSPQLAIDFIRHVVSSEDLSEWLCRREGLLPANRELARRLAGKDPFHRVVLDQMERALPVDSTILHAKAVERLLARMLNQVLVGTAPACETFERFMPMIDALVHAPPRSHVADLITAGGGGPAWRPGV